MRELWPRSPARTDNREWGFQIKHFVGFGICWIGEQVEAAPSLVLVLHNEHLNGSGEGC